MVAVLVYNDASETSMVREGFGIVYVFFKFYLLNCFTGILWEIVEEFDYFYNIGFIWRGKNENEKIFSI